MRLTKSTEIAIGILICLSATREARLTTHEVADLLLVRYTHAAKVVCRLVGLGLIAARRGRCGGLVITGKGRQTTVGWLVREFQHIEHDTEQTPRRGHGQLDEAMRQARAAFLASLDGVRVCDLAVSTYVERTDFDWDRA